MNRRNIVLLFMSFCIFVTGLAVFYPMSEAFAQTASNISANSTGQNTHQSGVVKSTEAIVTHKPTIIPGNEHVEDVMVLGHDVTVLGQVSEILIVLDGNVHLAAHSDTGLVVDIGGSITQDRGAHVKGMYHLSLDTPFWNGALFGVTFALLAWAGMLSVSVGLVVLAVLLSLGLKKQRIPLGNEDGSVRRMGVLGLLVSIAVGTVDSVLAFTLVGIPVAAIVAIIYVAFGVLGFAMTSLWMGNMVLRLQKRDRPNYVRALIGAILLTAFMNIPFVGLLLFLLTWFVGVGAATKWIVDLRRLQKGRRTSLKAG